MAVLRVVPNIAVEDVPVAREFYAGLLGLSPVMDHGFIATLAGKGAPTPQLSVAREGGSGTPVPDLSIEVDDLDAVLARARAQDLEILHAWPAPARKTSKSCTAPPTSPGVSGVSLSATRSARSSTS